MLALVACASQPPDLPDTKRGVAVDLSGNWEVDYKLTENAQEKLLYLYEIAKAQMTQTASRRADKQDVYGGRYQVEQAIENLNDIIRLGTLADGMSHSTVLKIEQADDYIVVDRDDDFALTCDFDTEPPALTFGQEWCGFDASGQLIFVSRLPEGLVIVHRLVLAESGERLSVSTTVKTDAASQPFTINRVYMPFEPGNSQYDCTFTLEKKKTCTLGPSD